MFCKYGKKEGLGKPLFIWKDPLFKGFDIGNANTVLIKIKMLYIDYRNVKTNLNNLKYVRGPWLTIVDRHVVVYKMITSKRVL